MIYIIYVSITYSCPDLSLYINYSERWPFYRIWFEYSPGQKIAFLQNVFVEEKQQDTQDVNSTGIIYLNFSSISSVYRNI